MWLFFFTPSSFLGFLGGNFHFHYFKIWKSTFSKSWNNGNENYPPKILKMRMEWHINHPVDIHPSCCNSCKCVVGDFFSACSVWCVWYVSFCHSPCITTHHCSAYSLVLCSCVYWVHCYYVFLGSSFHIVFVCTSLWPSHIMYFIHWHCIVV